MPGLLVLRFVFFPFFSFYHNILCAPRSFALLLTCLVLLICRNILRGRCNQAVEGRVGVTPHGGCSDACAPFCTIFLLRSFITVVGQTDAHGLEDGGKGTQERAATRAREGEADVRNVLYTARNVRWLSRKEDVAAHGQAFRQATDAMSGARRLPAVSLRATRTCATAALFAQSAVEDVANTERRL